MTPRQSSVTESGARAGRDDELDALPLFERAYRDIKERILSLELRPGAFVNETLLREMTGLGRMPVHQAVHLLQSERLLEIVPRKGILIRPDSLQDILALLEARCMIEPNVAGLAAERADRTQLAAMRKLLRSSEDLVDQSNRGRFMALDRAFHHLVAEASDNRDLVDAQRPLHERSVLIWHLRVWPADGLALTQDEHTAVYDAICNRDVAGARDAMRAHLENLRTRILSGSQR